jgi:hypothetical protein
MPEHQDRQAQFPHRIGARFSRKSVMLETGDAPALAADVTPAMAPARRMVSRIFDNSGRRSTRWVNFP